MNTWRPFLPQQAGIINAQRVDIRERDGTIKAVLSNSAGFSSEGNNQEGDEEGGLVYSGKAIPGGQDADVTLTFDQYRQDQNIYLHHEEHKDANGRAIDDGLTIISRPDQSDILKEYSIYKAMGKLSPAEQDVMKLKSLQDGKISTRRLL